MALVRVYVPTFRRANLLRRALDSLRAQTLTDWVAEVHNDDPADPAPAALVAALGDSRIGLRQHERNLGGVASFNLFFIDCDETYMSILEDDNWWEPGFLQEMVNAMRAHPEVSVAWANMRLWREEADGSWSDTGQYIWPIEAADGAPALMQWGQPRQAFGAMHSNGAMLLKVSDAPDYRTPALDFAWMESFRERTYRHPLLFMPRPLANFSQTRATHRADDRQSWGVLMTLLNASFLCAESDGPARTRELWEFARGRSPGSAGSLLFASFQDPALRHVRSYARLREWLGTLLSAARHPAMAWHIFNARRKYPELWDFLDRNTRAREREALSRRRGAVA